MEDKTLRNVELVVDIVSAYVSNNPVQMSDLSTLIGDVYAALVRSQNIDYVDKDQIPVPAVNPKRSIYNDYIVCLNDGRKFKSLKRHLMSQYGLSPQAYREMWGLPPDYPMVAPSYSAARSALAKASGLGRKLEEQLNPKKRRAAAS